MAWSDWVGPTLGTLASIGTAFIPGVGPVLAPLVGQGVNSATKGIDAATRKNKPGTPSSKVGPNGLTQVSKFTQGPQQQLHNESINQALNLLRGGQSNTFNPIANDARSTFASQTVPTLAERFGGKGNERGSSALTGQIAGAGAGLERSLAALRAQYGQKELGSLLGYGLQPSFSNVNFQEEPPFGAQLLEKFPELFAAWMQSRGQSGSDELGDSGFDINNLSKNQDSYDLENIFSNLYKKGMQNQPGTPGYQYNLGGRPA